MPRIRSWCWSLLPRGQIVSEEYSTGVRLRKQQAYTRGRTPAAGTDCLRREIGMIRKLKTGEYRLYSRKQNPKTGRRRNLGTFKARQAALRHERAVQYFKRH